MNRISYFLQLSCINSSNKPNCNLKVEKHKVIEDTKCCKQLIGMSTQMIDTIKKLSLKGAVLRVIILDDTTIKTHKDKVQRTNTDIGYLLGTLF